MIFASSRRTRVSQTVLLFVIFAFVIPSQDVRAGRPTGVDQTPIELHTSHLGHVDVGDQASGLVETGRGKKRSRRAEGLSGEPERPHESPDRLPDGLIVIND